MTIVAIIVIAILTSFIQWTIHNDEKVMEIAEQYEECVLEEFGTTPQAQFAILGEYPDCN